MAKAPPPPPPTPMRPPGYQRCGKPILSRVRDAVDRRADIAKRWQEIEEELRRQIDDLIATHPVFTSMPRRVRDDAAYRATMAIARAPSWQNIADALAKADGPADATSQVDHQ